MAKRQSEVACCRGSPILFPKDANRFAHIFSYHLNIGVSYQDGSNWVECEIYDPLTSLLSFTMRENFILADNGSMVWELAASTYRIYGILESQPHVSTLILTFSYAIASILNTPLTIRVKIEFGVHTVTHLIPQMVMNPFIPLLRLSHFCPLFVPHL